MESSQSRDQTCIPCLGGRFLSTVPPGKPQRDIFASSLGEKKKKNSLPKYLRTVLLGNLGGNTVKKIYAPMSEVCWTEDWTPWWWSVQRPWGSHGWQCGPEYRKRGSERGPANFTPRKSRERQLLWGECSQNKFQILRGTLQKKKNVFPVHPYRPHLGTLIFMRLPPPSTLIKHPLTLTPAYSFLYLFIQHQTFC